MLIRLYVIALIKTLSLKNNNLFIGIAVTYHFYRLDVGGIRDWPAFELWQGCNGLNRLDSLAGDELVDVMVSDSTTFCGDMKNLKLFRTSLSNFLKGDYKDFNLAETWTRDPGNKTMKPVFYLAQSPIMSFRGERGNLWKLMQDIRPPQAISDIIEGFQVNLWTNLQSETDSTCHYDPHPNLLCVVTGEKCVWLASPQARCKVGALPVWDESVNHASQNLKAIFESRSEVNDTNLIKIRLGQGDALFLPEGWYHQVSSRVGTLAINIWWKGIYTSAFDSFPFEAYGFRRMVQRLIEYEKAEIIKTTFENAKALMQNIEVAHLANANDHLVKNPQTGLFTIADWNTNRWMIKLSDGTRAVYRIQFLTVEEYFCFSKLLDLCSKAGRETISAALIMALLLSFGVENFMSVMLLLRIWYPDMLADFLLRKASWMDWLILTNGLELMMADEGFVHIEPTKPEIDARDSKRPCIHNDPQTGRTCMISERSSRRLEKCPCTLSTPEQQESILEAFFDELFSCVGANRNQLTEKIISSQKYLNEKSMLDVLHRELDLGKLSRKF